MLTNLSMCLWEGHWKDFGTLHLEKSWSAQSLIGCGCVDLEENAESNLAEGGLPREV